MRPTALATVPDRALYLLAEPVTCTLTTIRPDGSPSSAVGGVRGQQQHDPPLADP